MKKFSIVLSFLVVSVLSINAQAPLNKGGAQLNAGFGFSGYGIPIYGGVDFGVAKDFTLGVEGSFRSYSDGWGNYTVFGFLGNGNYHFNSIMQIPSEWDFYAGLNLGFYAWSTPNGYNGPHSSGLGLGLQVGGRYFFTPKFGINLEFQGGNTISGGKFGITYRFK